MKPIEERKEVIRLYTEEHHGYKTIAKETGISLNTVKAWIRRYRKKNNLSLSGRPGCPPKTSPEEKAEKDYERRIKKLEMEVELLRDLIAKCQEKHKKRYGYRRVVLWLLREYGLVANHKAVLRGMNKYNLLSAMRRKGYYRRMLSAELHFPNILQRDFKAKNHIQ